MSFRLDDYDYTLDPNLIAKRPVEPRDSSRLLLLDRKAQNWAHHQFRDLPEILSERFSNKPPLIVANNTKVIAARLLGRRVLPEGIHGPAHASRLGGKTEFLLLKKLSENTWQGLFHASAKHRPGLVFEVASRSGGAPLLGELIQGASECESGTVIAKFDRDPTQPGYGVMPLPQYILQKRDSAPWSTPGAVQEEDDTSYQTVYAQSLGSAAAPTAGLHFTPEILRALQANQARWAQVTLHVGLGTFRPVKASDIREHAMHTESFEVSEGAAQSVNAALSEGQPIIAVGTTSLRTLESAWRPQGGVQVGNGETDLFLYPGHAEFHVVSGLLTNFHLPRSTLLMLVSAFAGRELVLEAYRAAVAERYRFFSYGDAMLIL